MKKYNLCDLYVAEVKNTESVHHYICSKELSSNCYTEVLTGENIDPVNIAYIEPLSNYSFLMTWNQSVNVLTKPNISIINNSIKLYHSAKRINKVYTK